MPKATSSPKESFKQTKINKREHLKKNKVIRDTFARREYLLRELKETDAMLHHLISQLDLDEEYKKLTQV